MNSVTLEIPDGINVEDLIQGIESVYDTNAVSFESHVLFDVVDELGETLNDVECIALEATNEEVIVQIWIEKESNLPHRMIIESKTNEVKYYEAEYSKLSLGLGYVIDLDFINIIPYADFTDKYYKRKES